MANITYELIIKFTDGEVMEIKGVSAYSYLPERACFVVEKNNYKQFFPAQTVKYLGRKFDLEGK